MAEKEEGRRDENWTLVQKRVKSRFHTRLSVIFASCLFASLLVVPLLWIAAAAIAVYRHYALNDQSALMAMVVFVAASGFFGLLHAYTLLADTEQEE